MTAIQTTELKKIVKQTSDNMLIYLENAKAFLAEVDKSHYPEPRVQEDIVNSFFNETAEVNRLLIKTNPKLNRIKNEFHR